MKAFLLAAGEGRRLKPITDSVPKCLIPINGKPLFGIWMDLLKKHGITHTLVNIHYLAGMVTEYIERNVSDMRISLFYEAELFGSAGTLLANRDFIVDDELFFIIYADNLTDVNLSSMLDFHNSHTGDFTIGLFKTSKPQECGIAALDKDGLVSDFVEKPDRPRGNLAYAGIFIANYKLFDYIMPDESDFGFDILPKLAGKMHGYMIDEYLLDIGTLANYQVALNTWSGRSC